MLYKSSDADKRPNLTILAQLIEQHGRESEEVQAFIDLYTNDEDFMKSAEKMISAKTCDNNEGETDE